MNPLPALIKTPASASASGGSLLTLIAFTILPPVWPWWGHQDQTWRGAVVSVLGYVLSYLAVWMKVRNAAGQKLTMSLTDSRLPTVQVAQEPAKV